MSDIINKALEIAEEYPVFPCDEKKRPIVEGGYKAATQCVDTIVAMFSSPSAKLIGMPTGDISGLSDMLVSTFIAIVKTATPYLQTHQSM